MNRKIKTTGVDGDFGRDYRISCGHHSVIAQKRSTGSGYDCQIGLFTYTNITIKEAKERFVEYVESDPNEKDTTHDDERVQPDLWNTIEPCSVIVKLLQIIPTPIAATGIKDAIYEVLDNYGYLDASGEPDCERAERELERHSKGADKDAE